MNYKKLVMLITFFLLINLITAVEMDPNLDITPLCDPSEKIGCFDSDGEDYFKVGKASLCTDRGSMTKFDQCMSYKEVEEWICDENGNLTLIYYECYYKCKYGACVLGTPTCEDSDGGKEIFVEGSISGKDAYGNPIDGIDSCISSLELKEFFCDEGTMKSIIDKCPPGHSCVNGACVKDTTEHFLVVDDKGPVTDVIIISDLGIYLKYLRYNNIAPAKLNSEVTRGMLDDRVTTFVYLGKAVIITGSDPPSDHRTLVRVIEEFLEDEKGIKAEIIKSSDVKSDDLKDIFSEQTKKEDSEEQDIEPDTPLPVIPQEKDECNSNSDCDDNNACTSDLCSGAPKKCSNTETSIGCNYNGNCIPIGIRIENKYCDIDKKILDQKNKDEECNNNYECSTNLCINNKCISPSLIQKIINWFKRFFGA